MAVEPGSSTAGIKEVDDPVWPEPAYAYNVTENVDGTLNIEKKPQEVIDEIETEQRRQKREELFSKADVLFFKEQRGEISTGTWIAECQRIRQEYPQ